ncbi:MAG: hypothetical protein RR357_02070 [Clostridia bacterium]
MRLAEKFLGVVVLLAFTVGISFSFANASVLYHASPNRAAYDEASDDKTTIVEMLNKVLKSSVGVVICIASGLGLIVYKIIFLGSYLLRSIGAKNTRVFNNCNGVIAGVVLAFATIFLINMSNVWEAYVIAALLTVSSILYSIASNVQQRRELVMHLIGSCNSADSFERVLNKKETNEPNL